MSLGEGAIIAVNDVVTKNVEPCSIYSGIPGVKKSNRNRDWDYVFNVNFLPYF